MGNFFGGGLLTVRKIWKNSEKYGKSGGGQGLNWGGTKCPKIFLGRAILSHPPPTAEVWEELNSMRMVAFAE